MSNWDPARPEFALPKPGKALLGIMLVLFATWLMFAIAVNWANASLELFLLFTGNAEAILHGQLWRLLTAPLLQYPKDSVGSLLFTLIGLYFLTPSLEQRWGAARLLRFVALSAVVAYCVQLVVGLLLPATLSAKLIPEYWFGFSPVLEAIAIAWALNFREQQVRLMFLVPISAAGLVWFVVGLSVLRVIAASDAPEGLISPFGGMLAGWLFGGGTPSPMRRLFLKLKLAQLERETQRERRARAKTGKVSLEVIEGGKSDTRGPRKKGGRGPDGQWLN
ncbi:MAG TPA: rhomboid family intramembrane serine protease [Polyangiaceae bacterium]|jgi:membrane associated rhomboid family serine protease|nr:rhomboid family intramembrane serine protease [Polyangiaceae bacterium]